MSLNWKEIDLVLDELGLPGMQIQRVWQSAYDILHLELYRYGADREGAATPEQPRKRLLMIALSPGACRLHETSRNPVKPPKPLRFAEFFKSRIVNGWIEEARQIGGDRIVKITLRRGPERLVLWVRLWSNAANLVVTDGEGLILDAMRRSPKRGEVTGGHYWPEAPADSTAEAATKKIPQKEYQVRDLPGPGSFNSRLDAFYAEQSGALSLEALREEARKQYGGRIARIEAALEKLRERGADYEQADRFREYADIIMANLGAIRPGDAWLDADNFYNGEKIRIALDPKQKPSKTAEEFYSRYRKAKNGLEELRREIAEEEAALLKLRGDLENLLAEENPLALRQRLKKRPSGVPGKPGLEKARADKKKRPGLAFRRREWLILVGRDAQENDTLLRRHVKGQDLWLHAREYSGSYVFVKGRAGKSVPLDILLDAGNLALFYSKGRNNAEGDLFYTQVKFLRRVKDGPRGLVIPGQEKNLRVKLDPARLRALESCRVE